MSEQQPRHVGVVAGEGLVGRFGDGVVLITGDQGLPAVIADALSAEVPSGAGLIRGLLGWLSGVGAVDEVGFGIAVPLERGFVVLLRGAVWCEVSGAATRRMSGEQSLTWVDQLITEPFDRVVLGTTEHDAVAELRPYPGSDLRSGYVPGCGLVVSYTTRTPVVAADAVEPEPPAPENLPGRRTTRVTTLPVGALTRDGGPTIPLDRSYVLGRAPHGDPSVRDGSASPIQLRDPDARISRVHTVVEVDGRTVTVRDPGSAHGTYIAAPGAKDWTRVGAEPIALPPGWSLRVDRTVFVFEPVVVDRAPVG